MDNEIKGTGNMINYKYRVHDVRIGRFLSIDPLTVSYPHNSPYAFSENRVIDGVELEGREWSAAIKNNSTEFTVKIKVVNESELDYQKTIELLRNIENTVELWSDRKIPTGAFDENLKPIVKQYKINLEFDMLQNEDGKGFSGTGDFTLTLKQDMGGTADGFVAGYTKVYNTQENNIDLLVAEKIDRTVEVMPGMKEGGTFVNTVYNISETLMHELGHSAGLLHTGYAGKLGYISPEAKRYIKDNTQIISPLLNKSKLSYPLGSDNIMIQGVSGEVDKNPPVKFNVGQYEKIKKNVEDKK